MRRTLDLIYATALIASAAAMVTIAALVAVQIGGRLLDRALTAFGGDAIGVAVPSLSEIGGFLFVAAAFFALPAALRSGAHVRVTMLAANLPEPVARVLTLIVLTAAVALAGFATWHSWLQALDSYQFNSVSFGMIPIPLWIPQGAMTLGLGIFCLALIDEWATALRGGTPAFRAAEAARSVETGGH